MRLLTRKLSGTLTRQISGRRRSRYAAPVVLLLGLLLTGGTYAALAPANANEVTNDATTVAKGRALFLVGCASCHGKNAEGVVTKRGNQYGPSLAGVGAAAVDFQVGTGRMPMAQPGAQAVRKPPVYNDEETEALAAYVASLAPGPDVPNKDDYDVSDIDNEQLVQGGEFFRTNCTACHNFAAGGGAMPNGGFAPALKGVDEKHIFEAMLTGPQQMPVFSNAVLSPQDKKEIIAYIKRGEKQPNYGGFALGSIGPVSEGMFAWLVGIGGLVGFAIWIAAHSARSTKKKEA